MPSRGKKQCGLKIASRLYVRTPNGEREIQLCLGDITALPVEQKVDVIMVSAFQNDYSAIRTTVIGALHHKLGLSVQELARHGRQEDLRHKFNCWISKHLPEQFPYRQLLCFERPWHKNPEACASTLECVQGLFRAMMPIFNNTNKSVITPLLATGHQNFSESYMMKLMMKLSVDWMQIGLPLQLLKIVVFSYDPDDPKQMEQECVQVFKDIKQKVETRRAMPKGIEASIQITHDIFLVYPEAEAELAQLVCQALCKVKKKIKILRVRDLTKEIQEGKWQHGVSSAMLASARVVPLLTASFLDDETCIDQYNIAMCCNRQTQRHLLAPLCMDRIQGMPVYMGMVQWDNCRPRDPDKIEEACCTIVRSIESGAKGKKLEYDIFISYCHKNKAQAEVFLETLRKLNKKLRIFFDTDELKTGVSWQQTLYQALDGTRCMLALISREYLASPVCNEELNLAMARHLVKTQDMVLLPICIQDVDPIPAFQYVKPVNVGQGDLQEIAKETSKAITDWLKRKKPDYSIFTEVDHPLVFSDLSSQKRSNLFSNFYLFQDGCVTLPASETSAVHDDTLDKAGCDLFLSFTLSNEKHVAFILAALKQANPLLRTNDKFNSTTDELSLIDSAKCWVVFLSSNYLKSTKEVDELNQILSRQRLAKNARCLYVVLLDELPPKPTYVQLVPCDTALCDNFWEDQVAAMKAGQGVEFAKDVELVRKKVEKEFNHIPDREVLALVKATCDIEQLLQAGRYLPEDSQEHQGSILHSIVALHKHLHNNTVEDNQPQLASTPTVGCHGDGAPAVKQFDYTAVSPGCETIGIQQVPQVVIQHGQSENGTDSSSTPHHEREVTQTPSPCKDEKEWQTTGMKKAAGNSEQINKGKSSRTCVLL